MFTLPTAGLTKNEKRFCGMSNKGGGCMSDDVLLNKASIIERCLKRIDEEYQDSPGNLTDNIERQDSIILNLQRACEASIDMVSFLNDSKK